MDGGEISRSLVTWAWSDDDGSQSGDYLTGYGRLRVRAATMADNEKGPLRWRSEPLI
jgi:hypothetical protein